jgi:hypothetical protein
MVLLKVCTALGSEAHRRELLRRRAVRDARGHYGEGDVVDLQQAAG